MVWKGERPRLRQDGPRDAHSPRSSFLEAKALKRKKLQKVLGAVQIRPAVVHVQDKGQQKVVAFYASPTLFPRIPSTFIDHKANKRIVHYKQPDVHTTERTSNIYVKETKTDHHVGAHNKGLCQGARLSGFFPLPGNSMSRRRFGQLQVFSFEIGKRDVAVDLLDEIVPICFVEAELSIKEASYLLDILMKQRHLLDHHTISSNALPQSQQSSFIKKILSLPCRNMKVLFTAKLNLVRSYKYFNHVLKEARSHGASIMHLSSVSMTARTLFSSYRVKWTFMMSLGKHLLAVSCQFGTTINSPTKNMIRSLLQQSSRQILLAAAPNAA